MSRRSLRERTISGLLWSFVERFFRRGMGVVFSVVFAWLLVPGDFALIAMLTICLAIANVFIEAGFSDALIRLKQVSQTDLSTVFFVNIMAGMFVYALLYYLSPMVAGFYDRTELEVLLRVAGLAVVFGSFSTVQRSIFVRALNFKAQMRVSAPAALLSGGMAILLAFLGFGVWALVAQMVLQALLTSVFYWLLSDWRPSMIFSRESLARTFGFGGFLLLTRVFGVGFRQIYIIVITKFFSANVAGLYFFADRVRHLLLNQIVAAIQSVTYPALASMQDNDQRLKDGYRKVISWTSFLLCPCILFFVTLVPLLISVTLPDRWQGSGIFLQMIFLAGIFHPLHAANLNILKVKGRSDLIFRLGLVKNVMMIFILLISYRWGIMGILAGQVLQSLLSYIPNSIYSHRLIDYSVKEQLADFMPGLLLAVLVALPAILLIPKLHIPEALIIVLLASGMLLAYVSLAVAFRVRGFEALEQIARSTRSLIKPGNLG